MYLSNREKHRTRHKDKEKKRRKRKKEKKKLHLARDDINKQILKYKTSPCPETSSTTCT